LSRQGGELERSLDAVEQAIARPDETEESWVRAKFLSVKGELLLLRGASRDAAAVPVYDRFTEGFDTADFARRPRHAQAANDDVIAALNVFISLWHRVTSGENCK
jgi:hypothetical protein